MGTLWSSQVHGESIDCRFPLQGGMSHEMVSEEVLIVFPLSFQQQHLRKWMEVVVITHKGGQRSDGNVSDWLVSGRVRTLHSRCWRLSVMHAGSRGSRAVCSVAPRG